MKVSWGAETEDYGGKEVENERAVAEVESEDAKLKTRDVVRGCHGNES